MLMWKGGVKMLFVKEKPKICAIRKQKGREKTKKAKKPARKSAHCVSAWCYILVAAHIA